MGRTGITYQDVSLAASQLHGRGDSATVDNIRGILGTGSKSTIARHLKSWKSSNELNPGEDGLPGELLALVKGLWEQVQDKAQQQVTEHKALADEKIITIEKQTSITQSKNDELQKQVHTLEEALQQQTRRHHDAEASLLQEQTEKTKLIERNEALTQQNMSQASENQRLHQLLGHMQTNLEHYQAAAQKRQEQQTLQLEKQRSQFEQTIKSQQNQLANELHQTTLLKTQLEYLNKQLTRLQKDNEQLNTLQQETQTKLNAKQLETEHLKKNNEQYANHNESLMKEMAILQAEQTKDNATDSSENEMEEETRSACANRF